MLGIVRFILRNGLNTDADSLVNPGGMMSFGNSAEISAEGIIGLVFGR